MWRPAPQLNCSLLHFGDLPLKIAFNHSPITLLLSHIRARDVAECLFRQLSQVQQAEFFYSIFNQKSKGLIREKKVFAKPNVF